MRSCENTSSARSRAGWLRNSGPPSSAPSTTKRSWPEWLASPRLIACSMRPSTPFGNTCLARQWCWSRCRVMRLMLMTYQLPEAPPPPKLPPPPLKPPLDDDPLLQPPDDEPLDHEPRREDPVPDPAPNRSAINVRTAPSTPTPSPMTAEPITNQARTPTIAPVIPEPNSRPNMERRMPPMTSGPNSRKKKSGSMSFQSPKFTLREGVGSGSPYGGGV